MPLVNLNTFLQTHMLRGRRYVAARLQAALALLERLREYATLSLDAHKEGRSASVKSHEKYGDLAHKRLNLEPINKNHGRRSNNIGGWGQDLLDCLKDSGFEALPADGQAKLIDAAQDSIGAILRSILNDEPLEAKPKGRTAETVIRDLLRQAEEKGKTGEVAQYLVGAKLQLRLNIEIPVVGYNKGDRRFRLDSEARTGDFEIGNATIEVAMGLPDEKHLSQVAEALEDTDLEVWLLTRHDRVNSWTIELGGVEGLDMKRVVVTSVDSFVGQNISELGSFSTKARIEKLNDLFNLYNDQWVAQVGTPGIRITIR